MLLIGGRNYRAYFAAKSEVTYYPIAELYHADVLFPKSEDLVVFMGSLELSKRYINSNNNFSNIVLYKNLNKLKDRKIIFISSSAVYGLSSEDVALKTTSQLYGVGSYALEKIKLEALLAKVTKRLVIIRPSGFFGRIHGFEPRSFLNSLRNNISLGRTSTYDIEYSGRQLRDFTHIKDLMHIVEHFCAIDIVSKQCHNVSSTNAITIQTLTRKISLAHSNVHFNYIQSDEKKIHSHLENNDEIQKLLTRRRNIEKFLGLHH